jgi:hypothetical protein
MSPARPKSKALKSAATAEALGDVAATGSFGLMMEVNNVPIIVSASDLTNLAANGLTFNYDRDPPQQIGDLTQLLNWLSGTLKVTINLSDLEAAPFVGSFITNLVDSPVSIGQFDLRIQGTDKTKPASAFALAGSVALASPPSFGPLSITGFTFGASAKVTV